MSYGKELKLNQQPQKVHKEPIFCNIKVEFSEQSLKVFWLIDWKIDIYFRNPTTKGMNLMLKRKIKRSCNIY